MRLAKRTFYEPDFMVWLWPTVVVDTSEDPDPYPGRIEIHEVKGFWRDDARVKIKVAAEMFPMFKFIAVTRKGWLWKREEF